MAWYTLSFLIVFLVASGKSLNVKGLVPSVFTPFDEDGQLNLSVIPQYAEYLKKHNVNGALVAGTASEGPSLSLRERKALLDAWLKAARPLGLKIVMQVGGLPMPEALELARYSEKAGPDAILTLPELYYKPANVEALVRFVELVSAAAPSLPILYYDHPSLSGVKLNMAKFFNLATKFIPNFKGMKCNFATAVDVTASNDLNEDQKIFMASHATMASAYLMGYNSTMTTISNIFPGEMLGIHRAVLGNDFRKARILQQDLNKHVAGISELGEYVPLMKAAMEFVSGIKLGNTREPISEVSDEQRKILRAKIQDLDL